MNSEGTATWLYVAASLLVPTLWGASCAWFFAKLDARRLARLPKEGAAPIAKVETASDPGH